MSLRTRAAFCAAASFACAPIEDEVFAPVLLDAGAPLSLREDAGAVDVVLRLRQPARAPLVVDYEMIGAEAQNACPVPDFRAAAGRLEWAPGAIEARLRVWVEDDDLAELDERFVLRLASADGAGSLSAELELSIEDDDRSAIVDAREHGARPGAAGDQALSLQAALDAARGLGRAVVVVAPGDYDVSSVSIAPGTTLSGRGARFHRPAAAAVDVVSLRVEHAGAEPSAPTLIEGLVIDGRREQQGPFRDRERELAHLVSVAGDRELGGRVRATIDDVLLASGTASGVWVGSDAEVDLCRLVASELWRDAVTIIGGASDVRLKGLDATASEGTGLWIGTRLPGYEDSLRVDAELEDVQIGAGDFEIEAVGGSEVAVRGLTMTRPPLRIEAPDGTLRIADSLLMVGVASAEHDYFGRLRDVEITGSTLVLSETTASGALSEEARSLATVTVRDAGLAFGPAAATGRLLLDDCRFELASDVEPDDTAYAVQSTAAGFTTLIRASSLGAGFAGWFAPECVDCSLEP